MKRKQEKCISERKTAVVVEYCNLPSLISKTTCSDELPKLSIPAKARTLRNNHKSSVQQFKYPNFNGQQPRKQKQKNLEKRTQTDTKEKPKIRNRLKVNNDNLISWLVITVNQFDWPTDFYEGHIELKYLLHFFLIPNIIWMRVPFLSMNDNNLITIRNEYSDLVLPFFSISYV